MLHQVRQIVAGVTASKIARSPLVRLPFAAIASNIRSRVSSASAFDMFSIPFVSIPVTRPWLERSFRRLLNFFDSRSQLA